MKNRSPVCSASVEPKRIQCLGSSTNARLSICAVLPATTDSSTLSMAGRAVDSRLLTPLPVLACSSRRNYVVEPGLPLWSPQEHRRSAIA